MKLSEKQKAVIIKLRSGLFLFENVVTPGAKWCIGNTFGKWGNVHGRPLICFLPVAFAMAFSAWQ